MEGKERGGRSCWAPACLAPTLSMHVVVAAPLTPATQPLAAGGPAPPPPVLRPLAVGPLPPVPAEHRDDAVWLSLFDRAVAGVLAFVAAQLDVDALLLVAAAAAASEPAAAPPAAAGGAALRPNQLLPEVPPDTNVAVQVRQCLPQAGCERGHHRRLEEPAADSPPPRLFPLTDRPLRPAQALPQLRALHARQVGRRARGPRARGPRRVWLARPLRHLRQDDRRVRRSHAR